MTVEAILQEHYGIKKVYRKIPKAIGDYKVASGDEYQVYDYFTMAGNKAFSKLLSLFYDLDFVFEGDMDIASIISTLKELARAGCFIDVSASPRNTCLDSILTSQFGHKKSFLKKRKIAGYYLDGEPEPAYCYLTEVGAKAYSRLTGLIYSLGELLGDSFNTCRLVESLDQIVSDSEY